MKTTKRTGPGRPPGSLNKYRRTDTLSRTVLVRISAEDYSSILDRTANVSEFCRKAIREKLGEER